MHIAVLVIKDVNDAPHQVGPQSSHSHCYVPASDGVASSMDGLAYHVCVHTRGICYPGRVNRIGYLQRAQHA